jgi:hypothetical protein
MGGAEASSYWAVHLGLRKEPCKRHISRRLRRPGRKYPLHWRARWLSDDGLREHDQCFGPIRDVAITRYHAIQVDWYRREVLEVLNGSNPSSAEA